MKKCVFLFFVFLLLCNPAIFSQTQVACDFDNSSSVTSDDLMILVAYLRIKSEALFGGVVLNLQTVQTKSRELTGKTNLVVVRLPETTDDLENSNESLIGNNDLFLLLAYQRIQSESLFGSVKLDFPTVEKKAQELLGQSVGLGKFPGTPVGDSKFTTTVTGIQVDQ